MSPFRDKATYKELKSALYLEPAIQFAENLLGVRFNRSGESRYRAICPFHADTKDSFRVYVDGKGLSLDAHSGCVFVSVCPVG